MAQKTRAQLRAELARTWKIVHNLDKKEAEIQLKIRKEIIGEVRAMVLRSLVLWFILGVLLGFILWF